MKLSSVALKAEKAGIYCVESDCRGILYCYAGGTAITLSANGGGFAANTGLYAVPVLTPDRAEKRQNGRRFKGDGEPMFTLTALRNTVFRRKGKRRRCSTGRTAGSGLSRCGLLTGRHGNGAT